MEEKWKREDTDALLNSMQSTIENVEKLNDRFDKIKSMKPESDPKVMYDTWSIKQKAREKAVERREKRLRMSKQNKIDKIMSPKMKQ